MLQETAWVVTIIGVGIVLAAFLAVASRSGDPADFGPVQARFYRVRPLWLAALIAVGTWASVETLADLPYAATHQPEPAETSPALPVEVSAHQWRWEVSRQQVPAGRPVELRVRAADVNHGFALYSPDGDIVAQTQAMPGYVNELRHTFTEPGTYKVMCLEYCGLGHHRMTAELTVTARQG